MTDIDWQAEALRLKHEEGMESKDIAERVGKSASTVRKVIARAADSEPIDGQTTVDDHLPPREPGVGLDWPEMNPETGEIHTESRNHASEEPEPEDDPDFEYGPPEDYAAFKAEAGEPVGPMPPQPPAREMDQGEPVYDEITVSGTTQLGLFDAGGTKPSTASIRLQGGKVALMHGQAFRKGDVISFSGTAMVVEVGQRDKVDKSTRSVTDAEQKHVALITDLDISAL